MEKLDPKAVWLFFFNFLWIGFVLAAFLSGVCVSTDVAVYKTLPPAWWLFSLFLFVFLVWLGGSYFWAKLSYNAYKYQLTEDSFKKEHGVIYKKYVSIPYERIQNVDIYRGVLARILGLSDLMIQTAGYAGIAARGYGIREPEGRLPGVSKERAEQLREELIRRAKGTKGGV